MENLTIGQLAQRAQVNVETIRYYERRGLISQPSRPISGYRQYSRDAIASIQFIKHAKELGFSLKEISELLSLRVDPDTTCSDVKRRADVKIEEIGRKINMLKKMKKTLVKISAACKGGVPTSECPIIEALEDERNW